ncbi:peptidoglycan-binding protein [Streptomyces sp. NPDC001530]|uniref:peptidoglycan-binding protein n=1 Tax=Streptomyces sp. NPDC001530 TaxID=3364582 RepID=UPI00369BEACE
MSRWKKLPGSLDGRARQLVVQMRLLKDRSGLSTTALAARTAYSRSSWARYLNGRALPPRRAVAELARLSGGDATRLLVLHELAEATWGQTDQDRAATEHVTSADTDDGDGDDDGGGDSDDGAHADRDDSAPGSPTGPRRNSRRIQWAAAVGAAALTALVVGLVVAAPGGDGPGGAPPTGQSAVRADTSAYTYQPGRTYGCEVRREHGLMRAGHSDTRVAVLQNGSTSWDVVEAQCLLRHHGFSPGPVDGIFGERTERAVQRFQEKHDLVVDGKVGPHTWRALRR